jgi:bis(5'-nucleosyl)-tetraphosphatase (symmetrical)
MATYAIGDIQGCFTALQKLLNHIHFNPERDTLWFTGDLVNRGSQSLEVLRFVKGLGEKHITVLGNHDLHLLAMAYGTRSRNLFPSDTLEDIFNAPDKNELMTWLCARPLLHDDPSLKFVMTHAGLAPCWSLEKARELAREVETVLRSDAPDVLFGAMYGNQPDLWQEELTGLERLRCIINYFTRMRFCDADGRLDLSYKGDIANKPKELIPWFDVPHRLNANNKIIFGHWAALAGNTNTPNVYPLDTGCVWGNSLTALRLEDEKRFGVSCK